MPLSGPGGKIAVFELSRAGKLPDGVIPTLVQGTNVMDFAWDPFNFKRLAVGKGNIVRGMLLFKYLQKIFFQLSILSKEGNLNFVHIKHK